MVLEREDDDGEGSGEVGDHEIEYGGSKRISEVMKL